MGNLLLNEKERNQLNSLTDSTKIQILQGLSLGISQFEIAQETGLQLKTINLLNKVDI